MVTRVGLRIPTDLHYGDWEVAGFRLAQAHNSSSWCLGDWIVYGQSRYEDRYRTAIAAVGLDYQTLRNYAWVARRFELERRREKLSFQHHAEVAALPADEQDYWLKRAERLNWSRNQLRGYRHGNAAEAAARKAAALEPPNLLGRVPASPEQLASWRRAAQLQHTKFEIWVLRHLDSAAAEVLDR